MNIILAHGYLGFRSFLGTQYFNGVQPYLESRYPVKVVATQVDPVQGVTYRGKQLHRQVLVALGATPAATPEERAIAGKLDAAEPVHLIAHSMGSLDCRYLISPGNPDNLANRVATLSTIGGPHRGTPIVDLLYADVEGQGLSEVQNVLRISLPLAVPVILAGIRTAAVQIVSAATRAVFIGGGGLGELISSGMGLLDIPQLLVGAILVAALAIVTEFLFGGAERLLVRST